VAFGSQWSSAFNLRQGLLTQEESLHVLHPLLGAAHSRGAASLVRRRRPGWPHRDRAAGGGGAVGGSGARRLRARGDRAAFLRTWWRADLGRGCVHDPWPRPGRGATFALVGSGVVRGAERVDMAWREALRAPAPRSECEVCRATPSATRRQGAAWPTEGFAVLPQFHFRHQAGRPGGHAAVAALLGWQCLFGLLPRSRLRSPLGGVGLVHGELLGRGLWPAAAAAHGRGAGRRGPRH